MRCKDFFNELLIKYEVSEIFGLPGGVILDFVEAVKNNHNTRLALNEQSGVFSAIGYSRAKNSLGVAYASRGPGITNTLTSIADAYFDSVPILLLTGHSGNLPLGKMRTFYDQEIDVPSLFRTITKQAIRVETPEEFVYHSERLINLALSGRPGPVLMDVKSDIWNKDLPELNIKSDMNSNNSNTLNIALEVLKKELSFCKRPLLLLGDGFRGHKKSINEILAFASIHQIPILSGRFSQDLFMSNNQYFGYLGSHGLRSGNFIISKADLVIAIGNRMHYPIFSKSWKPVMEKIKVLWFDIDEEEFKRDLPNSNKFNIDLKNLCTKISMVSVLNDFSSWQLNCQELTNCLFKFDISGPIPLITEVIKKCNEYAGIICDVGNHEFWVTRAYFQSKVSTSLIFSKSFGAMGSALGKSIGFAHATKKNVLCFIGDQGLMINIQDLHYIAHNRLPIKIFVMNNMSSGMIRSRQIDSDREVFQTTIESGYSVPEFVKVANSFGIDSYMFDGHNTSISELESILQTKSSSLIELRINPEFEGRPHLPLGAHPTKLIPKIPNKLYEYLRKI